MDKLFICRVNVVGMKTHGKRTNPTCHFWYVLAADPSQIAEKVRAACLKQRNYATVEHIEVLDVKLADVDAIDMGY